MFDKKAFRALSYGLYIVSAESEGRRGGCVVNTLQQVTSSPAQVSVAINKENATADLVRRAGRFAAVVLAEDATMELIGTFGFKSSADIDKFASCAFAVDGAGMPYVAEQAVARFSARVVSEVDLGTHVLFVGEVDEAEVASDGAPMTYAYYHQVKGGKTPPKASSYTTEEAAKEEAAAPVAEASAAKSDAAGAPAAADDSHSSAAPEGDGADAASASAPASAASDAPAGSRVAWRCTICGHIEYLDELPDDYACPLCGMGKEFFEKIYV